MQRPLTACMGESFWIATDFHRISGSTKWEDSRWKFLFLLFILLYTGKSNVEEIIPKLSF